MFNFFSPIEVVKKYYFDYFINLHNKSHSSSIILNKKIEELRKNISKFFLLKDDFIVSFQTTLEGVSLLIFNYLKIQEYTIYTDDIDNQYFKDDVTVVQIDFSKAEEIKKIENKEKSFI